MRDNVAGKSGMWPKLLVVRRHRHSRRRLARLAATYGVAFPARGREVRAWLKIPDRAPPLASCSSHMTAIGVHGGRRRGRERVRIPKSAIQGRPCHLRQRAGNCPLRARHRLPPATYEARSAPIAAGCRLSWHVANNRLHSLGAAHEASRIRRRLIAPDLGPVLSFRPRPAPMRLASPCQSRGANHRSKGSAIARDLRVNQMIRIPQVRVVDEEGAQLGVMPTPQALEMAQERGLDLVEVAPMAAPPVVKFLDFGQYKYELTKREKESQAQAALGDLQGSPPLAEDRHGRLRHQGPSRDRVPRGRRPDQGDGPLPRSGADPSGARSEPAREVRRPGQGPRRRRADAAPRGQVDAHHGGIAPQAEGARAHAHARARPKGPTEAAEAPDTAAPEQAPAADRRSAGRAPGGHDRGPASRGEAREPEPAPAAPARGAGRREGAGAGRRPQRPSGTTTKAAAPAAAEHRHAGPRSRRRRRVRPACRR